MARPTKYSSAMVKRVYRYIREYEEKHGDAVPQIASLAVMLKISRETVYAWAKDTKKPEFSDAIRVLMAEQERALINKGLLGDYNATITKLALTRHDYKDRAESTVDMHNMTHEDWLNSLDEEPKQEEPEDVTEATE